MPQLRSLENNPTFVAAIIGGSLGFVSMSHHIMVVWGSIVVEGSTSYPLEMIFVGSLLAGFLARLNGGRSKSAGIAAAALALLPMAPSVSTAVIYFFQTYGIYGIGWITAVVMLFVCFIFLVSGPTGLLGGGIGGWIGNKFTAQSGT